jgi:hypothetical protein
MPTIKGIPGPYRFATAPRARRVEVTSDELIAHLADGRTISVRGMLDGVPARRPSVR